MDLTALAASALRPPAAATSTARGPERTAAALADLLGTDRATVRKALQGSGSLADLAASAGVSRADLLAAVKSTLPATGPDGASTDGLAADIVSGSRRPRTERPAAGVSRHLDGLAGSLGVSSSDLMRRLSDGTGIRDLLATHPEVRATLAATGNRGALVDGYA